MFSAEATALASILLVIIASATAGSATAKHFGRSPCLGSILGAALPVIGVGIIMWLGRKSGRPHQVQS